MKSFKRNVSSRSMVGMAQRSTRLSRGPLYAARGRIRRLSAHCSSKCALHPVTRAMAKIGVKRSIGMPSVPYTEAEKNASDASRYASGRTDGVTEGYLKNGEELGAEGVQKIIDGMSDVTPKTIVESIEKELNWGAEKLRDDITCMAININNTELIKKK